MVSVICWLAYLLMLFRSQACLERGSGTSYIIAMIQDYSTEQIIQVELKRIFHIRLLLEGMSVLHILDIQFLRHSERLSLEGARKVLFIFGFRKLKKPPPRNDTVLTHMGRYTPPASEKRLASSEDCMCVCVCVIPYIYLINIS